MALYILIGNFVNRIEREERMDLCIISGSMRHYETMQQLVDWIQREERMALYILIGNSVDLDRKEPRIRHYETMQQLVDWIQREERSVDLDRKEPRMRHYETINQLVDYIERKERMRHYETIKQVFGLNPREERETNNEGSNQRFVFGLNPREERETNNEGSNQRFVFGLNPREERVFGLNPGEERETIKGRANQRFETIKGRANQRFETKNGRANQRVLVVPDPIGEMETKNGRANQRVLVVPDPIGEMIKYSETQRLVNLYQGEEMMEHYNIQLMKHYEAEQKAILNADTIEVCLGKQEVHFSNRCSCHGTKLLKTSLSLAPFFLPSAGGTGHGSGQPEHQGYSEIYPSTLNIVSSCPSRGEYMQTSLTKCAEICGSYMQDGNCAYHCMRDSSKTNLVEFCAKPKPFFEYCPEYDPVDQTIQKDLATLCNSTFSQNYYNSSDIYFCDPGNCLQLHESSVRSGATTLTTLMNETTEMNGGDDQEWIIIAMSVLVALMTLLLFGWFFLSIFERIKRLKRKENQNVMRYDCIEKTINNI